NIWFEKTAEELLPEGYTNPLSPNGKYKKETDIMDVWFDSGSSHTSVLVERGYKYPFDLYLEGSDQYRGWFNSSLIIGTAINNCAPYKTCVSHGFVLDGKGNKMSKSLGNTIDPNKIIANSGADILRLWVASVDYQSDVRISDEIIKQAAEQYRKIRNTFRFLIGNLGVKGSLGYFDNTKDNVQDFDVVDSYILEKLKNVTNNCLYAYDNYDFSTVTTEIMNFMSIDLSSFYLDLTKDVLYCDEYDSHRRRQVQTVLYKTIFALLRLLAPILPHTCEEIYDLWYDKNKDSVHLLDMPKKEDNIDKILLKEYSLVLKLRSDILKALEEARTSALIGSSQEASLDIEIFDKDVEHVFKKFSYQEKIRLFIVSSLREINDLNATKYDVCKVLVKKDNGEKCERCWNRFSEGKLNEQNICPRCQEAVLKASKWEEK
ncbi:MAG: class I tRNA ligase family protein, partial [Bacilli bacterium]|nr:class I tRNA ligase family protein [Bacilli bacterium]